MQACMGRDTAQARDRREAEPEPVMTDRETGHAVVLYHAQRTEVIHGREPRLLERFALDTLLGAKESRAAISVTWAVLPLNTAGVYRHDADGESLTWGDGTSDGEVVSALLTAEWFAEPSERRELLATCIWRDGSPPQIAGGSPDLRGRFSPSFLATPAVGGRSNRELLEPDLFVADLNLTESLECRRALLAVYLAYSSAELLLWDRRLTLDQRIALMTERPA